jgi:hypothetical protein
MTIAIALKVGDGVVLGADSASSILSDRGVENVYFNAEKVFNLRKGLPIGAATYGLGGIGLRSITSLAKDLRERFTYGSDEWRLDPESYTMEEVAVRLRRFFYEELYLPGVRDALHALWEQRRAEAVVAGEPEPEPISFPLLGFIIAGFSAGRTKPEVWEVLIAPDASCAAPSLAWNEDQAGVVTYRGQAEALNRLLFGFTERTLRKLTDLGIPEKEAFDFLVDFAPLAHPAMPIQDALDLVDFLANTTASYNAGLFCPGSPDGRRSNRPCGYHEAPSSSKWVRRKHYYPADRNPPSDGWHAACHNRPCDQVRLT